MMGRAAETVAVAQSAQMVRMKKAVHMQTMQTFQRKQKALGLLPAATRVAKSEVNPGRMLRQRPPRMAASFHEALCLARAEASWRVEARFVVAAYPAAEGVVTDGAERQAASPASQREGFA